MPRLLFLFASFAILASCNQRDFDAEYNAKQQELNSKMKKIDAGIAAEMKTEFKAEPRNDSSPDNKKQSVTEP